MPAWLLPLEAPPKPPPELQQSGTGTPVKKKAKTEAAKKPPTKQFLPLIYKSVKIPFEFVHFKGQMKNTVKTTLEVYRAVTPENVEVVFPTGPDAAETQLVRPLAGDPYVPKATVMAVKASEVTRKAIAATGSAKPAPPKKAAPAAGSLDHHSSPQFQHMFR